MPYHVLLDTAGETKLGKLSIGTTRRGIGPCYADKALRLGIRVQDLLDEKILRTKIRAALEPKQQALRELSVQRRKLRKEAGEATRRPADQAVDDAPDPRLDLHAMVEEHVNFGHRLEPHIADTARLCWDALDAGETVIFEGAQATLLDLDHGTYPFVTSSNPIAGAATRRRRHRPERHRRGLGDRQGLRDPRRRRALPDRARRRRRRADAASAGTSSGPPPGAGGAAAGWTWSRCATRSASTGWTRWRSPSSTSSAASARCGSRSATARRRAPMLDTFPYHQSILHSADARVRGAAGLRPRPRRPAAATADLPPEARDYLDFIAEFVGVPVRLVGVGPDREQVVWIGDEPRLQAA